MRRESPMHYDIQAWWWPWRRFSQIRNPWKRNWATVPPPALWSALSAVPATAFSSQWPSATWTLTHACYYEIQVTDSSAPHWARWNFLRAVLSSNTFPAPGPLFPSCLHSISQSCLLVGHLFSFGFSVSLAGNFLIQALAAPSWSLLLRVSEITFLK